MEVILHHTHPGWPELIRMQIQLRDAVVRYWLDHDVFSGRWWFLLACTVLSWVIWLWLRDRRRLLETVLYGVMMSLAANYLDSALSGLVLWGYPHMEFPLMYPAAWVNFGPLPIMFMLTYQFFRPWKQFVIASVVLSAITAFIVEPFEVWIKVYELYSWRYYYSFPIYVLLFLGLRWILERVKAAARP